MQPPLQPAGPSQGACTGDVPVDVSVDVPASVAGFVRRHVGPSPHEQRTMLAALGVGSLDALIAQVVPPAIRSDAPLPLPEPVDEAHVLDELARIAAGNRVLRSCIGLGYHDTHVPPVILRNLLENPAWYTAYTPYQPEISQGRLEMLLNFQTMVSDLCGLDIANASLLDEASAAAEAMTFCRRVAKSRGSRFIVSADTHPQTIDVLRTRAAPLGIDVAVADLQAADAPLDGAFGVLVQYPGSSGRIDDWRALAQRVHDAHGAVAVATDLLALTLLEPPGRWGADVAVGSAQRFGVPMGYGGPHAAFFATRDAFRRDLPGRLVGVSIDAAGAPAYRLAMQTREQHIRREKASSNICTAQALLAMMAAAYACWHGPDGLRAIAQRVHGHAVALAHALRAAGHDVVHAAFFDTLRVRPAGGDAGAVLHAARGAGYNLCPVDAHTVGIALDETTTGDDVRALGAVFGGAAGAAGAPAAEAAAAGALPPALRRDGAFLTHPVFSAHHGETQMLRYLRRLADRDLALDRTMIPLGSCTMKLNATTEMIPVTWPAFARMHPFAPADQAQGYAELARQLERMLCACTGYDAFSLQPNSGAQGEYAGLLAIRQWHASRGQAHRNVCLIPASAHGTNPASAQMAGMKVVVVATDRRGNVDVDDLRAKADAHRDALSCIMITYPSTHGVFEARVREVCDIVHDAGGQVYIDGANMNAQVGLSLPGRYGGDVSHLNLHKTFCIPHGGGGPGVGPVGVRAHLAPFLPGHVFGSGRRDGAVSAAPLGSAGILPITWTYVRMMGPDGLRHATEVAILNANYVAHRLAPHFPILYTGEQGRVAHECIVDLRPLREQTGVTVEDVAKRLIDYGFHAPTMSFPVAGTLMIEPTESEPLSELDRFCDAMIAIRDEIAAVADGRFDATDNPLANAPHTLEHLLGEWSHPYTREQAAWPVPSLRRGKYWAPVGRVDNVHGDRNLVCSCPPVSAYS